MINFALINLKKFIKGIIKIIIVTLIVAMIFKFIGIIRRVQIAEIFKIKVEQTEKNILQGMNILFKEKP